MAFVSVLELNRNISNAKITFYANGSCMLPKVVSGAGSSMDMEVDFEIKEIRLRVGHGLSKKVTDNGASSVPAALHRKIISAGDNKAVISLDMRDDGWWYGSYGEAS